MANLLIVDDESNTREGLLECIEWAKLGVNQVEQAEDGLIALQKTRVFKPDIILCDIRMPRMNGLEFSAKVRDFLPECKIIFLSGYSDKEYLKTAIQLQALDYIEKPVNLDEVRKAVGKAIALLGPEKIAAPDDEVHGLNKNVADIIRYIRTNFSDINLSLKSIADFSSLTPTYICSIFKAGTGKTIRQFIIETRMEKAKGLLRAGRGSRDFTDSKIQTVAKQIGYADPKYFAKLFRKYSGTTPSEFRERNRR